MILSVTHQKDAVIKNNNNKTSKRIDAYKKKSFLALKDEDEWWYLKRLEFLGIS